MQEAKSGRPGSCRPLSGTGVRAREGKPLSLGNCGCRPLQRIQWSRAVTFSKIIEFKSWLRTTANLMCQIVCSTNPFGEKPQETIWNRTGTSKKCLEVDCTIHLSVTVLKDSTNQITGWRLLPPVEPVHKSNSFSSFTELDSAVML